MSTDAVLQQSLHLGLLSITLDCWALSTFAWVMRLECFIQGHFLTVKGEETVLPV